MSVVAGLRKGKNRSVSTTAVSVVLGLFVLLFLIRYGQELLLEHDLNDRTAIQRRTNATLRDENARLKANLEYDQSNKYIEQRAREDLNLRRPDEEVLVPANLDPSVAEAGVGPTLPAQGADAATAPAQQPTNWESWFGLFSPDAPAANSP